MLLRIALSLATLLFSFFAMSAPSKPHHQIAKLIANQQPITSGLEQELLNDPDGQLILARFYEYGSYGLPLEGEKALSLYQRAAENGQMDAALYCWNRCLPKTTNLGEAIEKAAAAGDPAGLYLWSKWLADKGRLQDSDTALVKAARNGQVNAINELYLQHFINWSANETDVAKAEAKLLRCMDEGLVTCQLLLGAFYQRYNDADKALFHYLQLVQLDYPLSRTYLYADEMDALLERMSRASLSVLQSRVATALINHEKTQFDAYNRFKACGHQSTYACVRKVVKRDHACVVDAFVNSYFVDLRQTTAYRQCLNK